MKFQNLLWRKAMVIGVVAIAASALTYSIAQNKGRDPLFLDVVKIESQADAVFEPKEADPKHPIQALLRLIKKSLPDRKVKLNDPQLLALESEMRVMKSKIEAAAPDRSKELEALADQYLLKNPGAEYTTVEKLMNQSEVPSAAKMVVVATAKTPAHETAEQAAHREAMNFKGNMCDPATVPNELLGHMSKWSPEQQKQRSLCEAKQISDKETTAQVYGQFAQVVNVYFSIQKRLYANFMRNAYENRPVKPSQAKIYTSIEIDQASAHQNDTPMKGMTLDLHQFEHEFPANFDQDLNLRFDDAFGLYLARRWGSAQLRFNLWHAPADRNGNYDKIELGLNPQDKAGFEQAAMIAEEGEANYGKVLRFFAFRNRLVNHWQLQQMSEFADPAAPDLNACPINYISMRDSGDTHDSANENFYQSLWRNDRYEEYNRLRPQLAKLTQNNAILSKDDFAKFASDFLGSYQVTATGKVTKFGIAEQFDEASDELDASAAKKSAAEKTAVASPSPSASTPTGLSKKDANIGQNLLDSVEAIWIEKSENALLDSNFLADTWDDEQVADRIVWTSFIARRKILIDLIFTKARNNQISDVDYKPEEAMKRAETALDALLNPVAAAWKSKLKASVLNFLRSRETHATRLGYRDDRFNDFVGQLQPAVETAVNADAVKARVNFLLKQNSSEYFSRGKQIWQEPFEQNFIMARGILASRLHAWTPEQMNQFFFKKLDLWVKANDGHHAGAVSALAVQISKDPKVMMGMRTFFGNLSNAYYSQLSENHVSPAQITEENSMVYRLLVKTARESYQEFVRDMATTAEQKEAEQAVSDQRSIALLPTPSPTPSIRGHSNALSSHPAKTKFKILSMAELEMKYPLKRVVAVRDSTRPIVPAPQFKDPSYVPSKVTRTNEAALYLQAMSLLNISELVGAQAYDLPAGPIDFRRAKSFRDIEMILRQDSGGVEHRLSDQVFKSFLDQKLIAEVLREQVASENPFLNVRLDDKDDSPILLDRVTKAFVPEADGRFKAFTRMIGLNHNQESGSVQDRIKVNPQTLAVVFNGVLSLVASNEVNHFQEACQARPDVKWDENFKKIFLASPQYRKTLNEINPKFNEYEAKMLAEAKKSKFDKLNETMDPALKGPIYLLGIGVMIAAPYIEVGAGAAALFGTAEATADAVASASETRTLFGIGEKLSQWAADSGVSSLVGSPGAKFVGTALMRVMSGAFLAQATLQLEDAYFELPTYKRYALGLKNAQLGMFSQSPMVEADLKFMADDIHSKRVGAFWNALLIYAFEANSAWKGAKSMFGFLGKGVVERAAAVEGTAKILQDIQVETKAEFLARQGGGATAKIMWYGEKAREMIKMGRFMTVNKLATLTKVNHLTVLSVADQFGSKAALKEFLERMKSNLEATIVEQANLAKDEIELEGSIGDALANGTEVKPGPALKLWVKGLIAKRLIKTGTFQVLLRETELSEYAKATNIDIFPDFLTRGEHFTPATEKSAAEALMLLRYAYIKNLARWYEYWGQKTAKFIEMENSGMYAADAQKLLAGEGVAAKGLTDQKFLEDFFGEKNFDDNGWSVFKNSFEWGTTAGKAKNLGQTAARMVKTKIKNNLNGIAGVAGKIAWEQNDIEKMRLVFKDRQFLIDEVNRYGVGGSLIRVGGAEAGEASAAGCGFGGCGMNATDVAKPTIEFLLDTRDFGVDEQETPKLLNAAPAQKLLNP